MFKGIPTDNRCYKTHINSETSCCKTWLVFLVIGSNKEKRCFWVSLQHIQHDVEQCIENGTRLKGSCAQAELIVAQHICFVKELQAVGMFNISFYTDDISMMGLLRLKAILQRVFQHVVSIASVVHLKDKRIAVGHQCHSG